MPPLQGVLRSGSGGAGGAGESQPLQYFFKDFLDPLEQEITTGDSLGNKWIEPLISTFSYDASKGFGQDGVNNSTVYVCPGLSNGSVRLIAQVLDAADHEIGPLIRVSGASTGSENLGFVYGRQDDGTLKLSRMWRTGGSTSSVNLDTAAFAVAADDILEWILTADGDDYTLQVTNITTGAVSDLLEGTDTDLPSKGFAGFRVGFANAAGRDGWFKQIEVIATGQTHADTWSSSLLTSLEASWRGEEAQNINRGDSWKSNELTDVNNSVGVADGSLGINAFDFTNLATKKLRIIDNADLSIGNEDFTISCRVRLTAKAPDMFLCGKVDDTDTGREYSLRYDTGSDRFVFTVFGDGTIGSLVSVDADELGAVSIEALDPDSQAHAAGVFDGTSAFTVGVNENDAETANARIEDVSLWRRTLTAAEIASLETKTFPFD
jgi:hypothetical protein